MSFAVEIPNPYGLSHEPTIVGMFDEKVDALRFCNRNGMQNGVISTLSRDVSSGAGIIRCPDPHNLSKMVVVGVFYKYEDAVQFVRDHLGANLQGRLSVVVECDD